MKIISKEAWNRGITLIDEEFSRQIEKALKGPRFQGDEYSKKKQVGIEPTKLTDIPQTGFGSAERDPSFSEERKLDPTSGYIQDQEAGYDGRASDEVAPGQTRKLPETSPETTQIMVDDPLTINQLFRSESADKDKGSSQRVRQHLNTMYNEEPVRLKSKVHEVDELAKRRMI